MTEKNAEPINTKSFGVVMALSQLTNQPQLDGLGELGELLKKLIVTSQEIVAQVSSGQQAAS
jgi:hypothetical protein